MSDDIVLSRSTTEASVAPDGERISAEEVTTLNGGAVTAQKAQRVILSTRTANGTAVDITDPPTSAKQDTGNASLASILAKIISAPATEAKQDSIVTLLTAIDGHVDGLEGKDYATQTTLAAILAKLIASPATEAKQDSIVTLLTAIDAHVDGLEGKDYATQTTLAAILAKIIAAPSTEAKQDSQITLLTSIESYLNGLATSAETQPVSLASVPSHPVTNAGTFAVQVSSALPAGTNAIGKLSANSGVDIGDVDVLSLPRAGTPSQSSVANSTSSVSLLASNANRLGATIFNDDTASTGATLKVKLGATASSTSFTVEIAPRGYYEVPYGYTGAIDGIASAATGNARITEFT
jgi:hypothetical protein